MAMTMTGEVQLAAAPDCLENSTTRVLKATIPAASRSRKLRHIVRAVAVTKIGP